VGRDLLRKCHDIVTGEWAERIRALTPAERLDFDVNRIFLKVDAENSAAVSLYLVCVASRVLARPPALAAACVCAYVRV